MDRQTAQDLLDKVKYSEAEKRGIDRHAFLFGEYAVLSTCRLKLRMWLPAMMIWHIWMKSFIHCTNYTNVE